MAFVTVWHLNYEMPGLIDDYNVMTLGLGGDFVTLKHKTGALLDL